MLSFVEKKMKLKSAWKGGKAEECAIEVKEVMEITGADTYNVKAKIELDIVCKGLGWMFRARGASTTSRAGLSLMPCLKSLFREGE